MFDSIHWHIYGFTGVVDEVTGFGIIGSILGNMRVEPSVIPTVAAIAYVILALIAYFIGNISPSTLLAKSKGMDIKKEGSGNAGTTNALRVMGRKAGVITLVVDILKGLAAVFLAEIIAGEACGMYCAVAVIVGHIWPVVYKFKGGKGVATTFGALMAINPVLGLLTLAVVAVFVLISKRMSVGSIAGAICFPVLCLFNEPEFIVMGTLLAVIVLIKHRANIVRLLEGKEPKLEFFDKDKKNADATDDEAPAKPEHEESTAAASAKPEHEESTAAASAEPEPEPDTPGEPDAERVESDSETVEPDVEVAGSAHESVVPDADKPDEEPAESPDNQPDDESFKTPESSDAAPKNSRKTGANNKKPNTKKNGKNKRSYPNKKKNGTKPKNQRSGKGGAHKNGQSKSKGNRNNNQQKKKGGKKK